MTLAFLSHFSWFEIEVRPFDRKLDLVAENWDFAGKQPFKNWDFAGKWHFENWDFAIIVDKNTCISIK